MLQLLDQQKRLTANQWKIFAAATVGDMLDFFDFYLIGFILAFIIKGWNLTYGESGLILLSSGIGAPLGSLFWGWMADRIGRRKVMILTVLNFSLATGLMALTPDQGWLFLSICRFFVGLGVTGLYTVDIAVVQEFVPASKRGWVTGLTTTLLPAGTLLGALSGAYLEQLVGWRGLFAVGLLPAGLTLLIRAWVPESPHWLVAKGRLEEARRSIAWALQVDPREIALPAAVPAPEKTSWRELFRYPRSIAVSCLTGISQTGGVGLTLWMTTLFVLVLKVTPAEASYLVIWISVAAILGRLFCSWISDAMGRRPSVVLSCVIAAATMSLAGYLHDVTLAGVSVFYLMLLVQNFFGSGNYSIVGPYMAEVWPARLRASGMGLGYGFGNLGKFIGPLGLALIAGSSNYVSPKATLDALIPGLNYFAIWYLVGAAAIWFLGIETRGRSIQDIDRSFAAPNSPTPIPERLPAAE
ncbi:MAG: MFS transporter [Alphaproteobacteria bacterium]|nr:MFS transporter [Alphaproteobacteria bacterium]